MANPQRSVNIHDFSLVPRSDVPRSGMRIETTHKTTFDAGKLIPVYRSEFLPGDQVVCDMTFFARMATLLYPVMDNMRLTSFAFAVPYRLLWTNFKKFMGEQNNPGDSISYTIPQVVSKASGYDIGSLQDYLGLPTVGQLTAGQTVSHSTLALRAYNLIIKEWFRDENLQNSPVIDTGDGPDTYTNYVLWNRGKRFDYFTGALTAPQKGGSVAVPLGTSAVVKTSASPLVTGVQQALGMTAIGGGAASAGHMGIGGGLVGSDAGAFAAVTANYPNNLYADLTSATAATINQLRLAFQTQRFLEKDARGGTRYIELVLQHFNVHSPDARQQRPEYIGGGVSMVNVNPIAQTSATGVTGGSTPVATLAGIGSVLGRGHRFRYTATEHGIIIVLVCIDADLTYQQGLERFWSRSTRYDFYWPVFQALGEQSILNKEIWVKGDGVATDAQVFGYQERYAEYRFYPNQITGLFRSTAAGTLDAWHLAQNFSSLPTLGDTFIKSSPPVDRVVAVTSTGKQFLFDSMFSAKWVRPMPIYSVPGYIDHF